MKISIVLPTYNGAAHLKESIQSIIDQTYTDWELIIVNDCSTDNSLNIAIDFASIDDRIKVISNDVNKKLPKSLNIGFEKAGGEFLTWTSDDNIYRRDALQEMIDYLLENHDKVMVCARVDWIDDEGRYINTAPDYDKKKMLCGDPLGACFMYRAEVLDKVGAYDSDLFCAEDYDYWLRILQYYGIDSIGYISDVLYDYRIHSRSLSATKKDKVQRATADIFIKYLTWILEQTDDKNILFSTFNYIVSVYPDRFDEMKNKFGFKIPELSLLNKDIPNAKKLLLYGAGNVGKVAASELENAIMFVDGNLNLQGSMVNGLKVISYEMAAQLINDSEEYYPVVAVAGRSQFAVISRLLHYSQIHYSVYFNCM